MQGAVKIYRGSAAAARHYVEADRPRLPVTDVRSLIATRRG